MKTFVKIFFIATVLNTNSFANILYVPSVQHPTIQAGIDSSMNGDTVLVDVGTYLEHINFNGKNIVIGSLFILEGDTSYISQTVIDGNQNGSVVIFANGEDSTAQLCGFTIQHGSATFGGGIYCNESSPTIRTNKIVNNQSGSGGGIFCGAASDAEIVNNLIAGNASDYDGGGIYFDYSSPAIIKNVIKDNISSLEGGNTQGGGIAGYGNSTAIIANNLIANNSAVTVQQGYFEVGGGGIALDDNANAIIVNNTLVGNQTVYGYGGGIFCDYNASPVIINNIITGSPDGEGVWVSSVGANPIINYNNIWDNADGNYGGVAQPGPNDISENPNFVGGEIADYHLNEFSLCIGAGSIEYLFETDLDGNPRPNPPETSPDLGAYENELGTPLQEPNIVVSDDSLDFGQVFLGVTDSLTLVVSNTGTLDLLITSIGTDLPEYAVTPTFAGLNSSESEILTIKFLPQSTGTYQGELTIISNDPDSDSLVVILNGQGVEPPEISVYPDSLTEYLFTGQNSVQNLIIENTGGSDLDFCISGAGQNYALEFDGEDDGIRIEDNHSLRFGTGDFTIEAWIYPTATTGSSGWNAIITKHSGDDGSWLFRVADNSETGFVPKLNFDTEHPISNYYANTELIFNTWYHIAVTRKGATGTFYLNGEIDGIFTDSKDLYSTSPVHISDQNNVDDERFTGTIDEVRLWNVARTLSEIQADMYREITGSEPGLAGYWQFDEGSGTSVYDQTLNGNTGSLQNGPRWVYSTAPISTWLAADPDSGTIPPGSATEITMTFDATGLLGGSYSSNITISSNDPDEQLLIVPARLHVTGIPNISISDTTLDFNGTFIGFPKIDTLIIYNLGTDTLLISEITSNSSCFTVNTNNLSINSRDHQHILVTFTPDTTGDYSGALSISSNDPDEPLKAVSLKGKGLISPDISVSPDSLSFKSVNGDSASQSFMICNIGGSDLNFRILGAENYALQFDGNDDYVSLSPSLIFNEITFSAWIKTGQADINNKRIFTIDEGEDNEYHYFDIEGTGMTTFTAYVAGEEIINYDDPLTLNSWTHVALTYEGSNVKIYKDGILIEEGIINAAPRTGKLYIGGVDKPNYSAQSWDGMIDEVRIWSVARTEYQIRRDMHHELTGSEPGLVSYLRFNEGSGFIVFDQTANGHDGSLWGGMQWIASDAPVLSWLSACPSEGTVSAEDSIEINVTCYSKYLQNGIYDAKIVILSNDPDEPTIKVPFSLEILTPLEDEKNMEFPKSFALFQNYPNPFNPRTVISYQLPVTSVIDLSIYNILGQKISMLVAEKQKAGKYEMVWDASGFSSGIYFYRLSVKSKIQNFVHTKKLILLK